MPRYYRRRYTRVVRPKKKWASNIKVWNNESLTSGSAASLVANSTQSASPTPTILKVGNFKISADLFYSSSINLGTYSPACIGYILYVPEGWGTSSANFDDLIVKHPEWIMATKTMGGDMNVAGQQFHGVESINVSTRLKRNLNSGDQVVFYIKINTTDAVELNLTGTCRYWTCSN